MNTSWIPDKTANFNVYKGTAARTDRLIGVTDEVNLFDLKNKSATINLAGFAGDFDSPAVGQYENVAIEIPFTDTSAQAMDLAADDTEPIFMRSAQEFIDPETGIKHFVSRTITVRGMTANIKYGSLKKGEGGKPSITKNVYYIKDVLTYEDNTEDVLLELNKFTGTVTIMGKDMTQDIQSYI